MKLPYSTFIFEKFTFHKENQTATFVYSFDETIVFEETITWNDPIIKYSFEHLQNFLFHIHIALGISYYKCYPVNHMFVKTGALTPKQIDFWNRFYIEGLGEFFYKNNIFPFPTLTWNFGGSTTYDLPFFESTSNTLLVPIGGGKDSIVTLELLKQNGWDFSLLTIARNDHILYKYTEQISQKKRFFIQRTLAPTLQTCIDQGAYNGHVPITGIISWISILTAYFYDFKYVIMSNEFSANIPTCIWNGTPINHQWSKSIMFEKLFREYLHTYISPSIEYFSLLRPWYEIQIASIFSHVGKQYFGYFSSCNKNFSSKNTSKSHILWCNQCPKCAFIYSILRPFFTEKETQKIFGEELYEKKELLEVFFSLIGYKHNKPFECVGDSIEVAYALFLAQKHWNGDLPFILQKIKKIIFPLFQEKIHEWNALFGSFFSEEHCIPKPFIPIVKQDYLYKGFKQIVL